MDSRRIVLTGASRGLGRALLDGFAAAGHTVIGCARAPENVAELRRAYGLPHRFDVVDVANDRAVAAWAASALEDGPPELLVNNAALIHRNAPLWELSAEEFDQVIAANVLGVANVVRHFVPAMVARRRGVIVNFSSYWGRTAAAEVSGYCASKFAVEGLTAALAAELPAGMAAVPLNPGIVHTEMLETCFGDAAASYLHPSAWARQAAPFILGLGPQDNGQPLTVPGQ